VEVPRLGAQSAEQLAVVLKAVRHEMNNVPSLAWVYAPRDSPLYALEAEARTTRRGLWSEERPVPPCEWRACRKHSPLVKSLY